MKRPKSQFRFIYPERGTIAVSLGIVLGYFLVVHTTGQLSRSLRSVYPTLFPEPVHTLALGLLAFVTIMSLSREGYRQYQANPRMFMSREEVRAYHSIKCFETQDYQQYFTLTLVSAGIVMVGWSRFLISYEGTVRVVARLYINKSVGPVDPMNVIWGTIFLVSFAVFAVGLDRLVVALWQDLRFQLFKKQLNM